MSRRKIKRARARPTFDRIADTVAREALKFGMVRYGLTGFLIGLVFGFVLFVFVWYSVR